MRPLKAFINQASLQHNLATVKQLAPHSKIMSVVKANGYGHGLINVARGLNESDGFAVLTLNEAIDLREHGFEQDILLKFRLQQKCILILSYTIFISYK